MALVPLSALRGSNSHRGCILVHLAALVVRSVIMLAPVLAVRWYASLNTQILVLCHSKIQLLTFKLVTSSIPPIVLDFLEIIYLMNFLYSESSHLAILCLMLKVKSGRVKIFLLNPILEPVLINLHSSTKLSQSCT